MATLEQEIANLNEEIKECVTMLKAATSQDELQLFSDLIHSARETLNNTAEPTRMFLSEKRLVVFSIYFFFNSTFF